MATSLTKKGLIAASDKVIVAARPALEIISQFTTDFSAEELSAEGGTSKTLGAVVEEYINKPAGNYADVVTFTAEICDKTMKISVPFKRNLHEPLELVYAEGETWAQIAARNSSVLQIDKDNHIQTIGIAPKPYNIEGRLFVKGVGYISKDSVINPTISYLFSYPG